MMLLFKKLVKNSIIYDEPTDIRRDALYVNEDEMMIVH